MITKKALAGVEESLRKRKELLHFIEKNEPIRTEEIAIKMGLTKATLYQWLRGMEEDGHVVSEKKSFPRGGLQSLWSRGPNKGNLRRIPLRYKGAHGTIGDGVDITVNRRTVPAKQIGIRRGELETFLFGPARAAA